MNALKLWIPAISMMLVSLISYIDRNTLALLAPTILAETGLSTEQYGYIIAAFSVAYMLANPLWGRWLDRVGLRTGMTAAVAFWTLASMAHAFAHGFWSFTAARAALGFGEGATFPGGLRTVMQTLPRESRSKGVAVAYSGGSLGAIVTPILITPIAVRWGWRGAFWFTGLVGAAWLTMWWFVSRMRAVREKPAPAADALEATAPPRLFDRRLWAFISAYALGAMPLGFVLYIAAIYLKTRGLTQIEIGALLWIPPLGWEVGYFFWGWLTDRWVRSDAPMAVYRRLFAICTLLSVPLATVTWIEPLWLLMTELFLAMFVTAGFIIVGVSYATRVFSTSHAGLIAGIGAGSWSAAVAIIMPVAGRLFDQQRYDAAFMFATCFPVVGFLGWLWLSRAATSESSQV